MAAPTIAQIMAGLDTRLATISGLRHTAYIADQINPPHAIIHLPDPTDYHSTMQRGYMELDFAITVVISATVDRASQVTLGTYLDTSGTYSIRAALEGDRTLAGVVEDLIVNPAHSINQVQVNGVAFAGARWPVKVIAKGV